MEKSERQEQNQDLRCQSGPSAKDSVIFSGGYSSKNYGTDQQRLQISDLHFDKFPRPATFACWKIRFKTEVCTCSQFPSEAMQWIKEVVMVDSVDELRSSLSTRGISMPNFVVKNQGTKQRVQRILGDCWRWETNGQCVKGDNCSIRHDMNKRGKVTPPNPSPNSFMQQNERKSSRNRSPRGKSQW